MRLRPAARAVVMDPAHRILLVQFDLGVTHEPALLWACPGGGVDPGETTAQGLVRELREELGLADADPGPPIWTKEHHVALSTDWDGQADTFYWVQTAAFEPRPAFDEATLRAEHLIGMRWWPLDELVAEQARYDARAPGHATFSPRRLGHLVIDLLRDGRPARPLVLPAL